MDWKKIAICDLAKEIFIKHSSEYDLNKPHHAMTVKKVILKQSFILAELFYNEQSEYMNDATTKEKK